MLQTADNVRDAVGAERYGELRGIGANRPVVDLVHETSAWLEGAFTSA